jgi:hypothetical protein
MQHTLPVPILPKFEQSATNEDDGPKEIKDLEEEGLIDIDNREIVHADP